MNVLQGAVEFEMSNHVTDLTVKISFIGTSKTKWSDITRHKSEVAFVEVHRDLHGPDQPLPKPVDNDNFGTIHLPFNFPMSSVKGMPLSFHSEIASVSYILCATVTARSTFKKHTLTAEIPVKVVPAWVAAPPPIPPYDPNSVNHLGGRRRGSLNPATTDTLLRPRILQNLIKQSLGYDFFIADAYCGGSSPVASEDFHSPASSFYDEPPPLTTRRPSQATTASTIITTTSNSDDGDVYVHRDSIESPVSVSVTSSINATLSSASSDVLISAGDGPSSFQGSISISRRVVPAGLFATDSDLVPVAPAAEQQQQHQQEQEQQEQQEHTDWIDRNDQSNMGQKPEVDEVDQTPRLNPSQEERQQDQQERHNKEDEAEFDLETPRFRPTKLSTSSRQHQSFNLDDVPIGTRTPSSSLRPSDLVRESLLSLAIRTSPFMSPYVSPALNATFAGVGTTTSTTATEGTGSPLYLPKAMGEHVSGGETERASVSVGAGEYRDVEVELPVLPPPIGVRISDADFCISTSPNISEKPVHEQDSATATESDSYGSTTRSPPPAAIAAVAAMSLMGGGAMGSSLLLSSPSQASQRQPRESSEDYARDEYNDGDEFDIDDEEGQEGYLAGMGFSGASFNSFHSSNINYNNSNTHIDTNTNHLSTSVNSPNSINSVINSTSATSSSSFLSGAHLEKKLMRELVPRFRLIFPQTMIGPGCRIPIDIHFASVPPGRKITHLEIQLIAQIKCTTKSGIAKTKKKKILSGIVVKAGDAGEFWKKRVYLQVPQEDEMGQFAMGFVVPLIKLSHYVRT
jgi:hypothetical protein